MKMEKTKAHFKVIQSQKETKSKTDYARLTFILSVIGFLGSIGFYLGVLKQIYSSEPDQQKIEQLQIENQELKATINVLIQNDKTHD